MPSVLWQVCHSLQMYFTNLVGMKLTRLVAIIHLSLRTPYIWTSILFRDMLWVEAINWFNPALFVYLSQDRTCISNIIIMLLSPLKMETGPGFQMHYVTVFFVFNDWRWEMIICFVDIGGIVDHQCLTFFRWGIIICFVDIGGIVEHHCLNLL
jgi:hypothetical protein